MEWTFKAFLRAEETVVANHDALNQQDQVEHQSANAEGRRSTPTSEEWLIYYPIFKQLYVVENMKLKDVQRTLEGQFVSLPGAPLSGHRLQEVPKAPTRLYAVCACGIRLLPWDFGVEIVSK